MKIGEGDLPEDDLAAFIKTVDTSGDGLINLKEFMDFLKGDDSDGSESDWDDRGDEQTFSSGDGVIGIVQRKSSVNSEGWEDQGTPGSSAGGAGAAAEAPVSGAFNVDDENQPFI